MTPPVAAAAPEATSVHGWQRRRVTARAAATVTRSSVTVLPQQEVRDQGGALIVVQDGMPVGSAISSPSSAGRAGEGSDLAWWPGPPDWGVAEQGLDDALASLAEELRRCLPIERLRIESHTSVETAAFGGPERPHVTDEVRRWAVVADAFDNRGRRVTEADAGWSGPLERGEGLAASMAGDLSDGLRRGQLPLGDVPCQAHLLLSPSSTAALFHEAVGHLLEDVRGRRSPLRDRLGTLVGPAFLGVTDDPTADGTFGQHGRTAIGEPTRPTSLVDGGHLVGLLGDDLAGPWRSAVECPTPAPRMSWLRVRPDASDAALDAALGTTTAPTLKIHRFGVGSLGHRDSVVVIDVKDASSCTDAELRLPPFSVVSDATALLQGLLAVGSRTATWTAYCLGTSGRLPVGGEAPALLTGVVRTAPPRWSR